MARTNALQKHLKPGRVYRRQQLLAWSSNADRDLRKLVRVGLLKKQSFGVYACPKETAFGAAPPEDRTLVAAFLKDDRFLLTSFSLYNTLGVGTTQLYNEQVVYNHKRHGKMKLGNRTFDFRLKPYFPSQVTPEFLLVDLVNNLNYLAEDREAVLRNVVAKAKEMDQKKLSRAVKSYAGARARKFFAGKLESIA